MRTVKSFGVVASLTLFSRISSFVFAALLARELPSNTLGAFFLFQGVLGVLSLIGDFGIRGAAEKRISEWNQPDRYFTTALLLKSVLLLLLSAALILLESYINNYIGYNITKILILILIAKEGFDLLSQTINAELNTELSAIIEFLRVAVWVSSALAAVHIGHGIYAILALQLVSYTVFIPISFILSGVAFSGGISRRFVESILQYAFYDSIAGSGSKIFSWADTLLIGYFLTASAVSGYELSWRVSVAILFVGVAVQRVIFPNLSRLCHAGNYQEASEMTQKALNLSLFITVPAVMGIIPISDLVLETLFGEQYHWAGPILIILVVSKIFESADQIFSQLLQAVDRPEIVAKTSLIGGIVNILLNLLLVNLYGAVGCAVATGLSILTVFSLRYYVFRSTIPEISISLRPIGGYFLNSSIMVMIVYGFSRESDHLIPIVSLGVVCYLIISVLNPYTEGTLDEIVNSI